MNDHLRNAAERVLSGVEPCPGYFEHDFPQDAAMLAKHVIDSTEPGFHPHPTVPGMWIEYVARKPRRIVSIYLTDAKYYAKGASWYGPIPEHD